MPAVRCFATIWISCYLLKFLSSYNGPPVTVSRSLLFCTPFCTRASSEFRQIRANPSPVCHLCNSPDSSHFSRATRSRFDMTPRFSSAMVSPSVLHRGHQAQLEFRPRKINKESVSMVILVCFAMKFAFLCRSHDRNEAQFASKVVPESLNRP